MNENCGISAIIGTRYKKEMAVWSNFVDELRRGRLSPGVNNSLLLPKSMLCVRVFVSVGVSGSVLRSQRRRLYKKMRTLNKHYDFPAIDLDDRP